MASLRVALLAGVLTALGGCAAWGPLRHAPGTPLATVRQDLGAPTGEWDGADGTHVLEYATGPFGKTIHLLRFDAQGRLLGGEQVLTGARFAQVQVGMGAEALRQLLGRPSSRFAVARPPQTVWAYRHEATSCQCVGADDRVMDTAYGPDPACDVSDLVVGELRR